jgi:hypothetical protein
MVPREAATIKDVSGYCPACGKRDLHLMGTKVIYCMNRECPRPDAVYDLLNDPPELHHIMEVLPDEPTAQSGRWTLKHPLLERIDGELFDCELGRLLNSTYAFNYPPKPGRSRIKATGEETKPWDMEKLDD